MKKIAIYLLAFSFTAVLVSSCASPKYGCPSTNMNRPFRR